MQTDTTTLNSALQDFFVTSLQEMYWAEINMRNSLMTMIQNASSAELKRAFQLHVEQTEMHVRILEKSFSLLGLPAEAEPSVGLQGLFDEGWQVIDESETGSAHRDVALIIAAQKIEHYEIASYGSLITLARTLGHQEIVQLFKPVLGEEKETDAILTAIAEAGINKEATQEKAMHML
ncbi:MAG: YciE/YciF ferroxidase family protein [Chitinophagaceae bacterium]